MRDLILSFVLALHIISGAETAADGKLVLIPGGELKPFWILPKGPKGPAEPIQIQPFQTMIFPVTNSEFLNFVRRQPEWRRSNVRRVFADRNYLSQFSEDLKLKAGVHANSPVSFISWFAARAYCADVEMRLPALAEWEYMAAASEKSPDASQNAEFLNRILEWYGQPRAQSGLEPVGKRSANYYGVHDLHGLVWEWVDDFNSNLITGEGRTDGSLNRDLFCGAGGMSGGNKENYAAFMRFAFRSALKGASTTWNLGFRCVKDVNH